MDRVVSTPRNGGCDRRAGGPQGEGGEGAGDRELWLTDCQVLVDRRRASPYQHELLHCGLRVYEAWIVDYDPINGVRYSRPTDWPKLTAVAELPGIRVVWWAPAGLRSPLMESARYSLGSAIDPPPLTCVTLIARMLGLPKPWPRRPVELVETLQARKT